MLYRKANLEMYRTVSYHTRVNDGVALSGLRREVRALPGQRDLFGCVTAFPAPDNPTSPISFHTIQPHQTLTYGGSNALTFPHTKHTLHTLQNSPDLINSPSILSSTLARATVLTCIAAKPALYTRPPWHPPSSTSEMPSRQWQYTT
jgi:hypothetical protein